MPSLFKYRRFSPQGLESDQDVDNLRLHQAWLSSRVQFNDPFDSHINFTSPTPQAIFRLSKNLPEAKAREARSWIIDDQLSTRFHELRLNLIAEYEKVIDRYAIYCMASSATNHLLWSHYADCHAGYCVELDKDRFGGTAIKYRHKLFEIDATELLKVHLGVADDAIGKLISSGLNTKLHAWREEGEFRHISQGSLTDGSPGLAKPYDTNTVLAIIFGDRVEDRKRNYLKSQIAYPVKFKQARVCRKTSAIFIEECERPGG